MLTFQFLRDEADQAIEMQAEGDTLQFVSIPGDVITVSQYGKLIRRQVSGEGHEILLREVSDFSVNRLPYGARITVVMEGGEQYQKTIRNP